MPHVLGFLTEGDLERENIFLKFFLLLSFIALLHPAESSWVLPAQLHLSLKAKDLKKAHLISITRGPHLVLRKNTPPLRWDITEHRPFPVQPSPSCFFLKHLASLGVVNLDFLVVTQLDNPLCLPRLQGYLSNVWVMPKKLPYLEMRWGRGNSDFSYLGGNF